MGLFFCICQHIGRFEPSSQAEAAACPSEAALATTRISCNGSTRRPASTAPDASPDPRTGLFRPPLAIATGMPTRPLAFPASHGSDVWKQALTRDLWDNFSHVQPSLACGSL